MIAATLAARHLRALGCGVTNRPSGGSLTATWPGSPVGVDCEIGWPGPVDLPLADEAGVQAACGIMHVHGRKSGGPQPLSVAYASVAAGVLAAQGVLAALIARWRGAPVTGVWTSVAQAALLAVTQYLAAATAVDDWAEPLLPGGPPFVSADGVRFEVETLQAEEWRRFWSLAGAEGEAVGRGWRSFEQRYATATCPLPDELHHAALRLDYAGLSALAARAGLSIMPVLDSAGGPAPPPWVISPRPAAGGPVSDGAPSPQAGALPLTGMLVVESARRVQGPLAGHVLGMLGAHVIRVEPPGGDPMRGVPPMDGGCSARFRALNRGKEAAEIDIKSAAGRAAVCDLVAAADVFLHNWAPGRAERLELTAGQLARVNGRLVYAWASGWGDALGPCPPLGTDFMVQAYSGLAALVRPAGEPPAPSLMTLADVLGGLICAQGVLAALLARLTTGAGQRVDSSLLSAALVLRDIARTPVPVSTSVPACTDLAALAADPRFAAALCREGAVYPRAPWRFAR